MKIKKILLNVFLLSNIFTMCYSCNFNDKGSQIEEGDDMKYTDRKIENLNIFNDECLNYNGRHLFGKENQKEYILLGFSATGFEVVVDVKEEINHIEIELNSWLNGTHTEQFIKTFVDGKENEKVSLDKGDQVINIFSNLKKGKHFLKFVKLNEASESQIKIYSINGVNVDFYRRVYKDRKLIQIYGDSLTCGYGILGNSETKTYRTDQQDATLSYGYLLANELNTDLSLVSWSGISLSHSFDNYGACMMDKYNTYEGYTKYDMNKDKPDLVVFNLGSNDDGKYEVLSKKEQEEGLKEFVNNFETIFKEIKKSNPNAKMLSLYNMCHDIHLGLINAIKEAVKNINNIYGADTAYFLKLANNSNGANNHPDVEGHIDTKNRIKNYIEKEKMI